jgi:hypothetical protein
MAKIVLVKTSDTAIRVFIKMRFIVHPFLWVIVYPLSIQALFGKMPCGGCDFFAESRRGFTNKALYRNCIKDFFTFTVLFHCRDGRSSADMLPYQQCKT